MEDGPPKKILLLHGNHQTGELLLGRIAKLHKKLKKKNGSNQNSKHTTPSYPSLNLEIIAPDAPFESTMKEMMKTWWTRNGLEYTGLEETMDVINDLWNSSDVNYSFEGIFAFSQGARLAHLIALLHFHSNGFFFPGLKFIVFVSGYDAPLPSNFPPKSYKSNLLSSTDNLVEESFIRGIDTLHVIGMRDQLITPEQSHALASKYENAVIHEHPMGHCVPMKAADVQKMISFIADSVMVVDVTSENIESKNSTSMIIPDEEHSQTQIDECVSLELIYPDTFQLLSPFEYLNKEDPDEGKKYFHPISFSLLVDIDKDDISDSSDNYLPKKPISLQIQYPPLYPDVPPILSLSHDMNLLEFLGVQENACLKVVRDIAQAELGMPCIMSCILALQDFVKDGGLIHCLSQNEKDSMEKSNEHDQQSTSNEQEDDPSDKNSFDILPSVSKQKLDECDSQGQEIAEAMLKHHSTKSNQNKNDTNSSNNNDFNPSSSSKGGEWKYTIGLVGKPSAGKSTFFNAATAFARQRNDDVGKDKADDGNIIFGASMAPHPFTTIDPNIGYCLVPAPLNSCPEDDMDIESIYGSTHGRDANGRRLLPVTLKDVAGLVPGAYQGRGKGNKFLNDLTDADVLIHVIDASGTSDANGNKTDENSHPLHDMAWIRNEIFEWIYGNVANKWAKISKRGKDKLVGMFSGYRQTQSFLLDILQAVETYLDKNECGKSMTDLHDWDQGDLRRLISAYLGVRFPIALALNKVDIPSSTKYIQDIQDAIPIHGARVTVSLSARTEMTFMKEHLSTNSKKNPKESIILNPPSDRDHKRPNGVLQCLQSAMSLREPILIFPVIDLSTYAPFPGLNNYATRDASLPNAGMIACLEALGGNAPSLWNEERQVYMSKKSKEIDPLRDVLMMRQGSNVNDVFLRLKRMGAVSGEFVRAEAVCHIGDMGKLVSKYDIMGKHNRIIKIMTTSKKEWQKK